MFHPGVSTPALPVQTVTLAAGTGGFDDDQCVGDEALQVVIVPKDVDGSPVKAPGRVAVAAYEVTPTGLKVPIGRWEVTPEELRKVWRTGLLSSGYFVLLQWDRAPTTRRIRVVVRFVTLDGREYESDRDANVSSVARAGRTDRFAAAPDRADPRSRDPVADGAAGVGAGTPPAGGVGGTGRSAGEDSTVEIAHEPRPPAVDFHPDKSLSGHKGFVDLYLNGDPWGLGRRRLSI